MKLATFALITGAATGSRWRSSTARRSSTTARSPEHDRPLRQPGAGIPRDLHNVNPRCGHPAASGVGSETWIPHNSKPIED